MAQSDVAHVASLIHLIFSIIAAVLSSALNHSFWWGVFHFLCGWMYVLYALIARSSEIIPALKAMFGS